MTQEITWYNFNDQNHLPPHDADFLILSSKGLVFTYYDYDYEKRPEFNAGGLWEKWAPLPKALDLKKCYIAGKIGDLPEAEYKAAFEKAKGEVWALGFEPVSPVDLPHNHGRSWSDYMREDLTAMLGCHSLYAMRNWRLSPGATIEINTALSVGINVIHQ